MSLLKLKKFVILIIFFSLNSLIVSETFRTKKLHIITINDITLNNSESDLPLQTPIQVGINDSICIKLPKDLTFIQGIELDIKIPTLIAKCPNTIIYSLYENISPVPTEKTIDYSGKELFTGVYPGLLSLKIQIPLIKGNTIKKTPYADKTFIPEHSRNFIFLRNQLAMKGVPSGIFKEHFTVSAKPILLNKGRLILKTNLSSFNNIIVTIDDKPIQLDKNNACFLKPGSHSITISGTSIRNENRSCFIEVAKNTVLEVNFTDTIPTIKVKMPQGTIITETNKQIEVKNDSFTLSPGEHTLVFSLGGYEIVKQVTIQEGRSYSIDITFDASFTEN